MNQHVKYVRLECTGDLTDYLSENFARDLEWGVEHLNGLPLYELMMTLKPYIKTNIIEAFYIGNYGYIDNFILSTNYFKAKYLYHIIVDPNDSCTYYAAKIN